MMGRHRPKYAQSTRLKEAIAIGLDEAFTALEESFHDLGDDQVASFPIPGRNNIAWIIMQSLLNLDIYANGVQTGKRVFPDEWRWNLWDCKEDERPKTGDEFPSREEMIDILRNVRDAAMEGIDMAEESELRGERVHTSDWDNTSADAYMRTIYHTMAHVRQIWLLRGALGMTDGLSWPRQHWA